jgi:hypothetical protein
MGLACAHGRRDDGAKYRVIDYRPVMCAAARDRASEAATDDREIDAGVRPRDAKICAVNPIPRRDVLGDFHGTFVDVAIGWCPRLRREATA